MVFNSYIFVLAFLPLSLVTYFFLGKLGYYSLQKISLIFSGCVFYGYANMYYLILLLASMLVNYIVSRGVLRYKKQYKISRGICGIGIGLNILLLFYFKYYDFFITNLNTIFDKDFVLLHLTLPLGISFFTFQQISYLIGSMKEPEKIENYSFLEYLSLITFYPTLTSGPITVHSEILPQFQEEKNLLFQSENFSRGLYIFSIGLFKKVLIADTLGKAVSWGYGLDNFQKLSALSTLVIILAYALQLYYDFNGYCEMASGIALMYNITLPLNFNLPYKATSIIDFWNRWHITLTRFLRNYIYIPLGGSRKGKLRTYINIIIVFLVSGLWHGANWTFVLWGALHGMANVCNRIFRQAYEKVWKPIQWILTFSLVSVFWVFFRAQSVMQGFELLQRLFVGKWNDVSIEMTKCFEWIEYEKFLMKVPVISTLNQLIPGLFMWILLGGGMVFVFKEKNYLEKRFIPNLQTAVQTIILLTWSIMSFSGVSQFLYFNF